MKTVYLLWEYGPNYDGGDRLLGVYVTREAATRDLKNRQYDETAYYVDEEAVLS